MSKHLLWTGIVIIAIAIALSPGCGGGGGGGGAATPTAPTGLDDTASTASTITISWNDLATNETGYEIQRRLVGGAWATAGQTAANATQFVDGGLQTNTTYEYRVRALGTTDASAWSAPITAATTLGEAGTPNAPSGLTVTGTTASSVTIGWTDNSAIETGYEVQRQNTGTFTTVATRPANSTSYTDTNVTAGNAYEYRVRALGASSNSAWSGTVIGAPGTTTDKGTVTGRVLTMLGAVPLQSAKVTIGGAFVTYTASGGTFSVANVPAGTYRVEVTMTGYQASSFDATVVAGTNNLGDIFMVATGDGPPPPPIL